VNYYLAYADNTLFRGVECAGVSPREYVMIYTGDWSKAVATGAQRDDAWASEDAMDEGLRFTIR
jgi:hypothetical protein